MSNVQSGNPKTSIVGKALAWFLARLDEPSTWASLAAAFVAVGAALQSKSGLVAAVLAGIVGFVKAEK